MSAEPQAGTGGVIASLMAPVWRFTRGDPEVCVAILDGPADLSHPCFRGAAIEQVATLVDGSAPSGPAAVHGTAVASLLFGQHGGPVLGVAPACRGLLVPIFRDAARGIAPCSQIDLARGLAQAVARGAHVINVSAAHLPPADAPHALLLRELETCRRQGVLVVAAAGNESANRPGLLGSLGSVLAVGAMDASGERLPWSNWSDRGAEHVVLAPGCGIVAALPGGGVRVFAGTSVAAPVVAGLAALLLSLQRQFGSQMNVGVVRCAMLAAAISHSPRPGLDRRHPRAGRLNPAGALALVLQGAPHMSDGATNPTPEIANGPFLAERVPEPPAASHTSPGCACGSATGSCTCGAGSQLVYALGRLGYDFGTEARRDSIQGHMGEGANPYDPQQILAYLDKSPWDAAELTWTLNVDSTPIYAVRPGDAFATEGFLRLRQFLREQLAEGVERVSIPGVIVGKATLMNGQTVPVVEPVLRGMYSWTVRALVEAVSGAPPGRGAGAKARTAHREKADGVANFLRRVYDELRNLGVTPSDRALNYAATNAFLVGRIFEDAARQGLELDTISVGPSPICRPGADCWDVRLTFFDPERVLERARKMYVSTVDVSDHVPVLTGAVRTWAAR